MESKAEDKPEQGSSEPPKDKQEVKKEEEAKEAEVKKEEETPKADTKAAEKPAEAKPAGETEDEASEEKSKRVYVGNLSWQVSWQDLKDHMRSTGLDATRANIMQTADGRSKGCGIVEFSSAKDAQQAILTLNDTELKGRQIFIREDREERPSFNTGRFSTDELAQNRRVYVGNLSWEVSWQDLKDHMKTVGDVQHVEVIADSMGRSKGCAIVEFATDAEAEKAIETLTNTDIRGRTIFVREDRESTSNKQLKTGPAGGRALNPSVYVYNLSPETSWQDLKDHMRKAGNVDSSTVFTSQGGDTSGIVLYQRPQDAVRAIRELQGSELHGSAINLREDRSYSFGRGGGRGGRGRAGGRGHHGGRAESSDIGAGGLVIVGSLSDETTWRELKDHFKQCGDVRRTEIKPSILGKPRVGTVHFYKKEDADAAVSKLNGSELQGSKIEVRHDTKSR